MTKAVRGAGNQWRVRLPSSDTWTQCMDITATRFKITESGALLCVDADGRITAILAPDKWVGVTLLAPEGV